MTCGIYKIENKINGKSYIGQSINIERRWKDHKTRSKKEDKILYIEIRKYGIKNFNFSILEECSQDKLSDKEIYWIDFYNSYIPNGYNQTFGGLHGGRPNKLSYEQVLCIRKDLKETNKSGLSLAKEYLVSKDTITGINVGRFWFDENINYPIRPIKKLIYVKVVVEKQLKEIKLDYAMSVIKK